MKRKCLRFFGGFLFASLIFLFLFSIASVAFVLIGYFVNSISPLSYAYLFLGEAIMPIEFLFNGAMGKFLTSNLNIIVIICGSVLVTLSFLALRAVSATRKRKHNGKKPKYKQTAIYSFILFAYFAFNFVMLILNYSTINKYLYKNINGVVEIITDTVGIELIALKCIIFSGLIMVFSVLTFVFTLLCKDKKQKTKITTTYVNFYSDEYLNVNTKENSNTKTTVNVEKEKVAQAPRKQVKKTSQDLITRIMQLNELKDTGQISDVEYTKLRQKAIKRYKV